LLSELRGVVANVKLSLSRNSFALTHNDFAIFALTLIERIFNCVNIRETENEALNRFSTK